MVFDSVAVAVPVAELVALLVVLALVGFKAPQGWSWRHALEQELSCPQAFTHWLPHSVHVK